MNYLYKYGILIILFFLSTELVYAQKKHNKTHTTHLSKSLTLKKKKTKKNKVIKRKSKLSNIDKIIFKELASPSNNQVTLYKLDTVPEKVISILSAFKPQLKNVAKISFATANAPKDTNSLVLNYQIPSQQLLLRFQPVPLVPRSYKSFPTTVLRNLATLKMGYGNYLHQLIDFNTTINDAQANLHTIGLKYESSQGIHPLQSTTDIEFKYLSDLTVNQYNHLQSQLFFQNNRRFRYGQVADSTPFPKTNYEQVFSHIGGAFKWVNTNEKNLFSLIIPVFKFEHFKGTENANNTWFEISNPLSVKFDNNFRFNFNFSYNYNQFQLASGNKINNAILRIDPSIELIKWETGIKLGVSPIISNGLYTFTPAITISKRIKDTTITLSAGWNTIVNNNNYTSLVLTNPWISPPLDMKITTQDKKNVGLSFNPAKHLQYGIGLSLNNYSNLPLFNRINNTEQTAQAGLKYETIFENKAVTIELEGNLRYQFSDKLLFQNSFKYMQFSSLKSNDKPWGISPIEFNSALSWSPNKKWSIDGGINYWSGASFINERNLPYELSNTLVLNAGFSYQFTRLWKVWAKGENLLDKPYQRWADYPSLGMQLIAGVVYSFHK